MDRTQLYKLMISQLKSDGYRSIATALEREVNIVVPDSATERDALAAVLCNKKSAMHRLRKRTRTPSLTSSTAPSSSGLGLDSNEPAFEEDLDPDTFLEFDERGLSTREGPGDGKSGLETKYITTHKKFVRCARFSPDGSLVATGSEDTSIKVLDVEKMKLFTTNPSSSSSSSSSSNMDGDSAIAVDRPLSNMQVAKPFYDHKGPVTDLDFHPFLPVLFSASKDCSIRMYDISQAGAPVKRSFKSLHDTHPVRSFSVHPGGEHLVVAAASPVLRVYDINTGQAMLGARWAEESHGSAVNQVRYAQGGRQFASAGKDGEVRVWDALNSLCALQIPCAHKGFEVSCASFSRNNYYLLTGGKDSVVRLWDLRMGKLLKTYLGAQQSKTRVTTSFSYTEDYIFSADEMTNNFVVWNAHTGELVEKLSGHASAISWVAASPVELSVLTCSLDSRARFWAPSNLNDD